MITVGISFIVIIFFSSVLAWGETSRLGAEIPMINGATVVKKRFEQGVGHLELEVNTPPNEVANFYQKVMEQKGWPAGNVMSIGNQSILMLTNKDDKFILKAKLKNGRTQVTIALIQKAQSKTIPKNSGMTIEGAPVAKSSFVKRIVVPAEKNSKYQPNNPNPQPDDPDPQPDDPNSNSDEPSNSNDKDIKSDDDSEKIPEILSVSLSGSVKWDIDEEIKKAWNYKGSVTYQYTGNMKLIQKADRETRPVLIYRPEGMSLSYNFNETFTDYVDECPVQFEHSGGGGSQIDESAELKIIRIGAMAAPYIKNLSADKQQFLTSMQGSIAIPDYYEFYASGPSKGGKMQGRTRFTGACDSYKPTQRSLAGIGGMVQMKIPKSGNMEGSRSWSADYQGTYPPSLNFFISDVASFLGKSPLSPPEGGKKNVTYNVSWKIGGAAKLQNTDSEVEDEDNKENCEKLQRRIDFLKIVKKAYADSDLRAEVNRKGGKPKDRRANYIKAIKERISTSSSGGSGEPYNALETGPTTVFGKPIITIRNPLPGLPPDSNATRPISVYSSNGEVVDEKTDFYEIVAKEWENRDGKDAGRAMFEAAFEHEKVHVGQFAKNGCKMPETIDELGDWEVKAHVTEINNLVDTMTEWGC